jgi:hypothetical protein
VEGPSRRLPFRYLHLYPSLIMTAFGVLNRTQSRCLTSVRTAGSLIGSRSTSSRASTTNDPLAVAGSASSSSTIAVATASVAAAVVAGHLLTSSSSGNPDFELGRTPTSGVIGRGGDGRIELVGRDEASLGRVPAGVSRAEAKDPALVSRSSEKVGRRGRRGRT